MLQRPLDQPDDHQAQRAAASTGSGAERKRLREASPGTVVETDGSGSLDAGQPAAKHQRAYNNNGDQEPAVIDVGAILALVERKEAEVLAAEALQPQATSGLCVALPSSIKLHILDWVERSVLYFSAYSVDTVVLCWRDLVYRFCGDSERRPVLVFRSLALGSNIGSELVFRNDAMLAFIARHVRILRVDPQHLHVVAALLTARRMPQLRVVLFNGNMSDNDMSPLRAFSLERVISSRFSDMLSPNASVASFQHVRELCLTVPNERKTKGLFEGVSRLALLHTLDISFGKRMLPGVSHCAAEELVLCKNLRSLRIGALNCQAAWMERVFTPMIIGPTAHLEELTVPNIFVPLATLHAWCQCSRSLRRLLASSCHEVPAETILVMLSNDTLRSITVNYESVTSITAALDRTRVWKVWHEQVRPTCSLLIVNKDHEPRRLPRVIDLTDQ